MIPVAIGIERKSRMIQVLSATTKSFSSFIPVWEQDRHRIGISIPKGNFHFMDLGLWWQWQSCQILSYLLGHSSLYLKVNSCLQPDSSIGRSYRIPFFIYFPSGQVGSVSTSIKLPKTLLAFHVNHRHPNHGTTGFSKDLSWIIPSLFLAFAEVIDWVHEPHL